MIDDIPGATAAGTRRRRTNGGAIRVVGPRPRARMLAALAALGMVVLIGILAAPAASAASSGFAITSYADGQFVSGGRLAVEGSAPDGDVVTVSADGADPCTTEVVDGAWRCPLTVPDGSVTVTATRTTPASVSPDAAPSDDGSAADAGSPSVTTPSPAPTPGLGAVPRSVTITLHVLGAPAIASGDTIGTVLRGSGYPGASVVLAVHGPAGPVSESGCGVVASDGFWSCTLDLATGDYVITARQHVPGHPEQSSPESTERTFRVDRDPPAPPVITSPVAGARVDADVVVAGTGVEGGAVSVFADGSLVCSAPVSDGVWSCGIRMPSTSVRITAIQRDAVGNYSAPSAAVVVTTSSATTSPTPAPTPSATAPSTPAPAPAPAAPTGPRAAPPSSGTPGARPPAAPVDGWGDPTGFGGALPAVATAFQVPGLITALAAAAAFVALVALPLRLARGALGPRIRMPRVFGRNRRTAEADAVAPVRSIAAMGVGWIAVVVAAAALQGTPGYVRLVAAVVLSLVVVNLVGVGLAGGLAARLTGTARTVRLMPGMLVLGIVAAVVSSAAGIDPPVIIGVVLSSAAADPRRSGLGIQIAQLAVVEVVAVVAWIAHSAVGAGGLWGVGLREALAAVAISGLCSTVALLLPIGGLPGRVVFERSRGGWAAAAIVASGLAAAALAHGASAVVALVLAVLVGAACLAVWAWVRWVEPALLERA